MEDSLFIYTTLFYTKKIEYKDALDICKSLINKMCATFENKIFKGKWKNTNLESTTSQSLHNI